jgi:mono/diheme cytochrome c family protein
LRWAAGALALWVASAAGFYATSALAQGDVRKGEYLAKASGCLGCHTDAADAVPYAGGRRLDTPFGTFYGPNITPHPQQGIGRWSEADFKRALREGVRPDGQPYYPVFPYTSFSGMSDGDIRDLWAYLRSLRPSEKRSQPHQLKFPYAWRLLVLPWKALFFRPPSGPGAGSAAVARGAYLVNVLGHCGECHSPRNWLGGTVRDRALSGGDLPEGKVPNLTPAGPIGKWTDVQLSALLRSGVTADGDPVSDVMDEVVRNTTSQWSKEDLAAVIAYLRSVPPLKGQ